MTRTLTPKGDSACALSAPAGASVCACMQVQLCQLQMLTSSLSALLLLPHLAASSASSVKIISIPLLYFKVRLSCQLWYHLVGLLQTGSFQKVCSRPEAQNPMQ